MVQAEEKPEAPPENAQAEEKAEAPPDKSSNKDSPWLITPLLSSDPKISTAAGVLAAYVHTFDEKSPASMFGVFFSV